MNKYLIIAFLTLVVGACKPTPESDIEKDKDTTSVATTRDVIPNRYLIARPDSVGINTANTAVIVVDMENDFGSNGGMFQRAGLDISMIQKAVAPTRKVLQAAREAHIKIIYLKMAYKADLSDLGPADSKNSIMHKEFLHVGDTIVAPDGKKSRILIRDSWGTEIVDELKPMADDIVISKTRFSGFYNTELDSTLKKLNMKYLIYTGCTTSVCVESTVRDGMFKDYSSIVLRDCTAEPLGFQFERSNHEASLFLMENTMGWISDSESFIRAIAKTSDINRSKF